MRFKLFILGCLIGPVLCVAQSGPYSPAANEVGSDAVHMDSPVIYEWASFADVQLGLANIQNTNGPLANAGEATDAIGKADGATISLGDGGVATLTFAQPLQDRAGADFAVFENGFYSPLDKGYFLELATVEVSSNGTDYVRFEPHSLTPLDTQISTFGVIEPTNINNLAGKYVSRYGTPFDLAELAGNAQLDIYNVTHIRITDVVGSIDSVYATFDSAGNAINEPFPTDFESSGFDLDAVGAINEALAVANLKKSESLLTSVESTWSRSQFQISAVAITSYQIISLSGSVLQQGTLSIGFNTIELNNIKSGVYFLRVSNSTNAEIIQCIKL